MKLNIGDNLRRLRREQNMTQETLAEKLGVSFQSVSRWENGTTYPDIEFLPAIARIFGTTVDGLIGCDATPSDEEMEQIMAENKFGNVCCHLVTDACQICAEILNED